MTVTKSGSFADTAAAAVPTRPVDADFELENYLYYNINRASNQYGGLMEDAFSALDIDQTAWRVLTLLSHDEDSTLGEIARRGMVKAPTLTRRIDRMVQDGLVLREVGTDDRRTVRVSLTGKGRNELARAKAISTEIFDNATRDIAAEDIAIAVRVLQRMRSNLEDPGS